MIPVLHNVTAGGVTMAVSVKEKELAAVGVSVAAGCKPCTDYHVKAARKAGAVDDEIAQAVSDAVAVRVAATEVMERHALAQVGRIVAQTASGPPAPAERIKALVALGAAFGVNCVSSLEQRLAGAEALGISKDEIETIVKLAVFIKERAASHVERLVKFSDQAAA